MDGEIEMTRTVDGEIGREMMAENSSCGWRDRNREMMAENSSCGWRDRNREMMAENSSCGWRDRDDGREQ